MDFLQQGLTMKITDEQKKLCIALRQKTNAGIIDCRNALRKFNFDFDKALDWIKEDIKKPKRYYK